MSGYRAADDRAGKPDQDAYVESVSGRLRKECLNERWFTSLDHAKRLIETWRYEYNEEWRKRSMGGLTPARYATRLAINAVKMPEDFKALSIARRGTSVARRVRRGFVCLHLGSAAKVV